MKKWQEDLCLSLRRDFPIVILETGNYPGILNDVATLLPIKRRDESNMFNAILHWDISRGAIPIGVVSKEPNEDSLTASAKINSGNEPAVTTSKFDECLARALDLMPTGTILVMDDLHLLMENTDAVSKALYIQCIRNCRDQFKSSQRALVFLCTSFVPPFELAKDITIIRVPSPTKEELKESAAKIAKSAKVSERPEDELNECADTLRGLSAFGAENLLAMAITEVGYDFQILRKGTISAINSVKGLTVKESTMTFDSILGLSQVKKFGTMKANGNNCPLGIILIDEISDQMSGRGDSNGINRDAQGQMLQYMQNCRWNGSLFDGFAGTGKTQIAGAIANACNAMFINFDMGAMKGGIVSQSERMIREALGVIWDRFGERAFFIGTTNSVEELTAQMIRRFGIIFFFDLLRAKQQKAIWDYYMKKFSLPAQELPPHTGWTGAEIERCAEYAFEFTKPLIEVAQFITPVIRSMGDGVEKMRKAADGKYLSADYPGYYQNIDSVTPEALERKIDLSGNN